MSRERGNSATALLSYSADALGDVKCGTLTGSGHLPQESKEDKLSRQIWFDEVVVGPLAKCSA